MPSTISAGTTAGTAIAIAGDTTGNLAFQTNGTTTAMTIDTSQNVGIGTATPTTKLDVSGTTKATTLQTATLNSTSGVLATQNGITGICKAWAQWNGRSGASPVIRASFNISSITRNATGDYTVNFTTAMPDVNYSVAGTGQYTDASTSGRGYFLSLYSSTSNPFTTGSVRVVGVQVDSGLGAYGDSTYITIIVCGN